jgi:PIN domain nuclease of toxin-antitoxin system
LKVLLDTHAFLWWVRDDQRLSARAREILDDTGNELLFSVASGWEIAIKARLGKLRASEDLGAYLSTQLRDNAMRVLPIYLSHAVRVADLPIHHHDPFDRLLVAQAMVEELPLLSRDPIVSLYPVEVIW